VLIKCVTPPIWGHSLGVFSQLQTRWASDEQLTNPASTLREPDPADAHLSEAVERAPDAREQSLDSADTWEGAEADEETSVAIFPAGDPPKELLAVDESAASATAEAPRPGFYSWPATVLFCLVVGACVTLSLMIARCVNCLRSIYRHRTTEFDEPLRQRLQDLAKKLRIRRVPRIIVSDVLFGPAVLGLWRHTIVLPRCLLQTSRSSLPGLPGRTFAEGEPARRALDNVGLPEGTECTQVAASREVLPGRQDQPKPLPGRQDLLFLDPILAHELLHIRRGDLTTGALQALVQSLWWFHPAVWLCNRWLSREAERCCDEQVIAELGCSPAQYARSLLSVIESKHQLQPIPVFPGMKPVEITSQRMERIMSLKTNLKKQTPLWCWLAVAALAIIVLPGAVATPTLDETKSVTEVEQPEVQTPGDSADAIRLNQDFAVTVDVKPDAVVAYVNDKPVRLADVVPSGFILNSPDHPKFVSPQKRPLMIQSMLRKHLPNVLYDELVMQHFAATVPDEQQAIVRESLKPELLNVLKKLKASERCESDAQLSERLAQEYLSIDTLEQSYIRMRVVSGYVQTLPVDSPLRAREKIVETVRSMIDDCMSICHDISLDENFVLSRTVPVVENAVISYVNGKPITVKSVLENTSTGILLKHIPEMDELDRRRLMAEAIEKSLPEYVFQEIIFQHFDAHLSLWEEGQLADAEAERSAELFRMLPEMLSKSKTLKNQEQLLSDALISYADTQKRDGGVLSDLSREARVSRLIGDPPSRQVLGVRQVMQDRCHTLLLEARLRSDVSLRFDDRDLTDVLRTIATDYWVNIAVKTRHVETGDDGMFRKNMKVTYQCENEPLGDALTAMLEPLGLKVWLNAETVMIGMAEEPGAADPVEKLHLRSYNVADLVSPIRQTPIATNNAASAVPAEPSPAPLQPVALTTESATAVEWDFATLVELIKTSIEPESWEDGHGAILNVDRKTISFVVKQTDEAHGAIAKLLSQLRKSTDSIQITARLFRITKDSQWKELEERCSLHPLSDGKRWALMTPSRSEDVALFLLHEKVEVLSSPRILTISGQAALMEVSSLVEGQSTGFRLSANPYLIADTFVIRLSHSVTIGELAKESPGAVHESLVGSGQTLVLLIEQAGTNEATPDRYVVLLTPEHLTEEEADRKQPNEESLRK
jgi:beta-lactamase regulating signal transducer with metallopeptidase domain